MIPQPKPFHPDNFQAFYKIDNIKIFSNIYELFYCYIDRLIGQVGRVFTNGPGDLCSIPGHIKPKTLKMVLDTSLLNSAI